MSATDYLKDLVRLPSVNPMGRGRIASDVTGEHRVTAYLERHFQELGVAYERQAVTPDRHNIVARIARPGATHTILFEVHQDTVPVDAMTIDPFGAEIRVGKLYGRGACDVKGSMAAMLEVFTRIVREKPPHAANLILACTVDEEHTFLGVQHLVQSGIQADFAVVAEPTNLNIVDAHKGVVRWRMRTRGRACHSSQPEHGINAIYRMGRLLTCIDEYSRVLKATQYDARLGSPTISVGRVEGGISVNTVPDECVIELDRRLLPGEQPADAPRDLIDFLSRHPSINFPFECDPINLTCPALAPCRHPAMLDRLGKAIQEVHGSHRLMAVAFGTDASTIAQGGIPTVVFGPGDIAQAHTANEWVDLQQVDMAVDILYRFVAMAP